MPWICKPGLRNNLFLNRLQLLVGAPLGGAGGDVSGRLARRNHCAVELGHPLLHQLRRWGDGLVSHRAVLHPLEHHTIP